MKLFAFGLLVALLAACSPRNAAPQATVPPRVVVVTLSPVPTRVPTLARAAPAIATDAPESAIVLAPDECAANLLQSYTEASDRCLSAESGAICHDAIVPASSVDSLQTAPDSSAGDIDLAWLWLAQDISADIFVIGEVDMRKAGSWREITLASGESTGGCESLPPYGALVTQSRYGQTARLEINGVAAAINGTLIALTQQESAQFIVIEGQTRLSLGARSLPLVVGTQATIGYAPGDWNAPQELPPEADLLDHALIADLPIALFPRPVQIPQPGYAQTQGGVNMRAAPDINGRLLYLVPAGETMSVLGISSSGEWLHIRLGNGETGWMSAALLAKTLGDKLPVYDEAPPPPQRLGVHANRAMVNVAAGGNLRAAPDTAFQVLRTLPYGTETTLLARSPYSPWVKAQADNAVGWMALFTLTTRSIIGSLPIDYQVPLPTRATPTPSFSFGGGHAYPDPSGGY